MKLNVFNSKPFSLSLIFFNPVWLPASMGLLKDLRSLFPKPRRFHSHKEMTACKIQAEIRRTRFPGAGPPM